MRFKKGTQEQLDAAREDAMLIPVMTYFRSLAGETKGSIVHRIDMELNDSYSVAMYSETNSAWDFHNAGELEPIA